MFAHAIHLADRRAGSEKTPVRFDHFVIMKPRLEGKLDTSRAAAGDQKQNVFVALDEFDQRAARFDRRLRDVRVTAAMNVRATPWLAVSLGNRHERVADIPQTVE